MSYTDNNFCKLPKSIDNGKFIDIKKIKMSENKKPEFPSPENPMIGEGDSVRKLPGNVYYWSHILFLLPRNHFFSEEIIEKLMDIGAKLAEVLKNGGHNVTLKKNYTYGTDGDWCVHIICEEPDDRGIYSMGSNITKRNFTYLILYDKKTTMFLGCPMVNLEYNDVPLHKKYHPAVTYKIEEHFKELYNAEFLECFSDIGWQ
tara:strand:+ start:2354 stop:2959 length:606 start_codon:yes stop_codon:yes gene_type:complete